MSCFILKELFIVSRAGYSKKVVLLLKKCCFIPRAVLFLKSCFIISLQPVIPKGLFYCSITAGYSKRAVLFQQCVTVCDAQLPQ